MSDRGASVLRRILDVVAAALRLVRRLAIASAVLGGVWWIAWTADDPPPDGPAWATHVLALALVLAPAAVLALFVAGIASLRGLPTRYRELPADLRERTATLRAPRGAGGGGIVAVFRLARLVLGSRDALSPFAVASAALRPAIVVAALLAAVAAAIEIPVAAIALVIVVL